VVGNVDTSGCIRLGTGSVQIRARHGYADTRVGGQRAAVTSDRRDRNGGGTATVVVGRDLILVPASVFFQRVQDVLTVRVDEIGPRFPQWMNDVVDESNLSQPRATSTISSF